MFRERLLEGLYVLTDTRLTPPESIEEKVHQAIQGGCRVVQFRDKTGDQEQRHEQAQALSHLCREHDVLFIINDDIALAEAVHAHGVHLGREDQALEQAREILGPQAIIGISCYNSLELAVQAAQAGADYVAFGSFFSSSIKPEAVRAEPELLTRARAQLDIPIVAIGGITAENTPQLIEAGADMVAVISAVFGVTEIRAAARRFAQLFQ